MIPLILAFGSDSSANELPETCSTSADPSTSVPCTLPANNGHAPNAAAPTKSTRVCNHTKHTIPAGTNLMSARNPSATKVNPEAKSGALKKFPMANKAGNLKHTPEQHAKQCAYCKSDQHQVHDCPHTAGPCCFKRNSPDYRDKDFTHEAHTNLKHSAPEGNLTMCCQQSAAPNDSCKHQHFRY